jgi:hypothetical protein
MSRQTLFALLAISLIQIESQIGFGQVIFAPVQYQYGADFHYYYGGSDPAVLARGDELSAMFEASQTYGAGDVDAHRDRLVVPDRIYSDAFPDRNPALFGFTAGDASNEANAAAPRFFRMSDELAAARAADQCVERSAGRSVAQPAAAPGGSSPAAADASCESTAAASDNLQDPSLVLVYK